MSRPRICPGCLEQFQPQPHTIKFCDRCVSQNIETEIAKAAKQTEADTPLVVSPGDSLSDLPTGSHGGKVCGGIEWFPRDAYQPSEGW